MKHNNPRSIDVEKYGIDSKLFKLWDSVLSYNYYIVYNKSSFMSSRFRKHELLKYKNKTTIHRLIMLRFKAKLYEA